MPDACMWSSQRSTLLLLVLYNIHGGMGDECEKFLKNLAELLAKEAGLRMATRRDGRRDGRWSGVQ